VTANVIPNVPALNPSQQEIDLDRVPNPALGVWWVVQSISQVPENIMGWLVAQGFEVTGITQDNTTVPPTNYFSLRKEGLQRQRLLLDLCNNYTIAANDARTANELRYNQIVRNWTQMIDTSQTHFNAQIEEQNLQSGVYLADLDTYMTAIETMIEENKTQTILDAQAAKIALNETLLRLGELEQNATANASKINTLFSEQETFLSNFINNYNSKLTELDQNFASYLSDVLSQITSLGTVLNSHIADYTQQFTLLANNYTSHAADIDTQLASVDVNVNEYVVKVDEILILLETDFQSIAVDLDKFKTDAGTLSNQFSSDFNSVLGRLQNEYNEHKALARQFLTDLGAADLARINEQFVANLSIQMQQLVSRGLYTSTIISDLTARNNRDRDENIQLLNDRLNREKLENQHRIYEQSTLLNSRTLDGKDRLHSAQQEVLRYQASLVSNIYALRNEVRNRVLAGKQAIFSAKDANYKYGIELSSNLYAKLQDIRQRTIESVDRIYQLRDIFAKWKMDDAGKRYERIQQIEAQFLESIQRQYAASQDVSKTEMSERHTLLSQLQAALTAFISGKERYAVLLMQNANSLAEHKNRAVVQLMETSVRRLEGWKSVAAENTRLMAYQIDERNKLLIGLYSFVERREDVAPEWKDMASMIAGLADAGGGWLTPN
jgi:hypothetical protein